MKLEIRPSDRLSVIGMTGSGKTTLLLALLRYWIWRTLEWAPYHIVILDTKKDGDFDGIGKKFRRLKDLKRLWDTHRILIYEPVEEEMNEEYYNGFFHFLRTTYEPLLIVIDELASVAKGNKVSYEYELLMKQGRGKQQAVWAGIQNPVYVPHDFLSNANHYFVFDLLLDSDRDKVAGIIGREALVPPQQREEGADHGFLYFSVKGRRLDFCANNPPVTLPVPPGFDPKSAILMSPEQRERGATRMNWKLILGILILALLMVLAIPLWKLFFNWLANTVPATQAINDYVART